MNLDPSQRVASPASSAGRASPAPYHPRRPVEDASYKRDKNYRKYASGIEKALSLFDTPQQEWADYISFLGRLLKAIEAHPADVPSLPHSDTIATRLAQSLNPTLPSGVHQKALEVYTHLFTIVGKDALARSLNVYLPGLVPVLSYASLTVRPLFLGLFEEQIVHLPAGPLKPALKALILCLLPGLEDETSEDFDRVFAAADKLRVAVRISTDELADSYFWQCFFLACITNASRRQGALAYLTRRLPKLGHSHTHAHAVSVSESTEQDDDLSSAEAVVSPEPGLLLRCFAAGLNDQQTLIQRGFLDILVTHVPLDSPLLQEKVGEADIDCLMSAAVGVVSRRDMSLNRRLWAWLLGPDPSEIEQQIHSPTLDLKTPRHDDGSHHAAYFAQFGSASMTRSLLTMLRKPNASATQLARPFRICLSLMDRWEVGGIVVTDVFVPAVESVYHYNLGASKEQLDEVLRSASNFFDGVESALIWEKIIQLLIEGLVPSSQPKTSVPNGLELVKFVLTRFNVREEDMLIHHMPLAALAVLTKLPDILSNPTQNRKAGYQTALDIADILISAVPERAYVAQQSPDVAPTYPNVRALQEASTHALRKITDYYGQTRLASKGPDAPFPPRELADITLLSILSLLSSELSGEAESASIETISRIACTLVHRVPRSGSLGQANMIVNLGSLADTVETHETVHFPKIIAVCSLLSALKTAKKLDAIASPGQVARLAHGLLTHIWNRLAPTTPKYHVEAVRCLWQLQTVTGVDRLVESSITLILSHNACERSASGFSSVDAARNFTVLWTHTIHGQSVTSEKPGKSLNRRASSISGSNQLAKISNDYRAVLVRPLLLLLDSLAESDSDLSRFVAQWLQELPSIGLVFETILSKLQILWITPDHRSTSASMSSEYRQDPDRNIANGFHYMKLLLQIIRSASDQMWIALAGDVVPRQASDPDDPEEVTMQWYMARLCTSVLEKIEPTMSDKAAKSEERLHKVAAQLLIELLRNPYATPLKELGLDEFFLGVLVKATPTMQPLLLEAELVALRLRRIDLPKPTTMRRINAREKSVSDTRGSHSLDLPDEDIEAASIPPPPGLVDCLKAGIANPLNRLVLENWVEFLKDVLPMFADTIFQNLLPLVECFCTQTNLLFEQLKGCFRKEFESNAISPESAVSTLLNGLEHVLAAAHDQLSVHHHQTNAPKQQDQAQSFFGNMVSGVFAGDAAQQPRISTANSRLTVLLCFQDTVRVCFSIWSWGNYSLHSRSQDPTSQASSAYVSQRLRNRARRMLEHLFAAEALECLETLIVTWCKFESVTDDAAAVLGLLNVLSGSKPRNTVPAIFNSIYSRSNPGALEPGRMSSLTSDIAVLDIVSFLIEYTRSLEDDAMDEIWTDCITFLRDVLANPLPHRQILPALLDFVATIAEKMENTNFGDQRRMRKELADIFTRLLTATFTTRPTGFLQEPQQASAEKLVSLPRHHDARDYNDTVAVLASILPRVQTILAENDRLISTATSISTNVVGPTFHAKAFPGNVTNVMLELVYHLTRVPNSSKIWRKDVSDAFNDAKFFACSLNLVREGWLPVLRQLAIGDKARLPEILSRFSAPSNAGIVFGVGASSARQEADRKTQLNLRRLAVLFVAGDEDAFVSQLGLLADKIVELLTATPVSSPSSATRAEVFILLRAIVLRVSPVHLAPFWPIINAELSTALSSVLPGSEHQDKYNNISLLQACKLLDTLVTIAPDDFQLHEWLFITDTIDAVYKPANWEPTALADEVAEVLNSYDSHSTSMPAISSSSPDGSAHRRKPFLDPLLEVLQKDGAFLTLSFDDMSKQDLVLKVLKPYLGQLSIYAFEATYGMGEADTQACINGVLKDLFAEQHAV